MFKIFLNWSTFFARFEKNKNKFFALPSRLFKVQLADGMQAFSANIKYDITSDKIFTIEIYFAYC